MDMTKHKNRYQCKECGTNINKRISGLCISCYNKQRKNVERYDSTLWKRICPLCNNDIVYTSYMGFYSGRKYNRACFSCGFQKSAIKNKYKKQICGR